MRLLIIEDERPLAQLLKKGFTEQGFAVDLSADGEDGLFLAENYPFDAILLDIMLPKIDGLTLLKKLRSRGNETPILMLTAKREMQDKVTGLEEGADDYIAKPFDFPELLARVRSVIRRDKRKPAPILLVGDLSIDTNSHLVRRAGNEISLSAKEYEYLEYLALNQERVVRRAEIIDHIYSVNYDFESNIIDVYVSNLRRKIDRGYEIKLLHTIRGVGYRLSAKGTGQIT